MPAQVEKTVEGVTTTKQVKNLGWLLRNWKRIDRFVFNKTMGDSFHDGQLTAILFNNDSSRITKHNRTEFVTDFASEAVLWDLFLRRPVFYGLPIKTIERNQQERTELIEKS